MAGKLTTAEFIQKAQAVHGLGNYDYSQATYKNRNSKMLITCLVHGAFEQSAGQHLLGRRCPECGKDYQRRSYTVAQFIKRAQEVHGVNRYDYSKVQMQKFGDKATIICSAHGPFQQSLSQHLYKSGCPQCGTIAATAPRRRDTVAYIQKANEIHGGRYDYSETVFLGGQTRITVKCPVHGRFQPWASGHLQGNGCRACATSDWAKRNTERSRASFAARCKALHARLDFSKAEYAGSKNKVIVTCEQHGDFLIRASSLLAGRGCSACGQEHVKRSWTQQSAGRKATLYFLRLYSDSEEFYKIGVTFRPIEERYNSRYALGGYQYEVMATHQSANAMAVFDWEQSIVRSFSHLNYWPHNRFDGETECFSSAEEILSIFPL